MSVNILHRRIFGDMQALYLHDRESGIVSLVLLPEGTEPAEGAPESRPLDPFDSLVQVKAAGDVYRGGYANGRTLRGGETTACLRFAEQEDYGEDGTIGTRTTLVDDRGLRATHILEWRVGAETLSCTSEFINGSDTDVRIEMLSSFNLAGITPFATGDAHERLVLHRVRSAWSMEGRLESARIEDLQLEPSWAGHAVRAERYGQAGSLAVNHWFPWAVIEDTQAQIMWGVQIAHNASWQIELCRVGEGLTLSGGLADRELGHWVKTLKPGEGIVSPEAVLTVCRSADVDEAAQRLTSAMQPTADAGPAMEQDLPILFNEYCTTWGDPSHENIKEIVRTIRDKGFGYFVIDCGWYRKEGVPWDVSMGDYNASEILFPDGIAAAAATIREAGMTPGLWFEIENVGDRSDAWNETDHLLKRDGAPLTTTMPRRFWDMTDPWVWEYLTCKVIGTLSDGGFGYLKIDCNDTIGIGCDDPDSLGEGLRRNAAASAGFIQNIKDSIPGIVIENCASGGQRQEPLMMRLCAMSSFSDAHECYEIPIIAANLHRVILPRQSQIWAVIRKDDSHRRIAWSMANTFLGRMCLSGDVTELSGEQWSLVEDGMDFYREAAPVIKRGRSRIFGPPQISYRHPKGWQAVVRRGEGDRILLVVHVFSGKTPEEIRISLEDPSGGGCRKYSVGRVYAHDEGDIRIDGSTAIIRPNGGMYALGALFEEEGGEMNG